jgi:hypothetical protein
MVHTPELVAFYEAPTLNHVENENRQQMTFK